MRRWRCVSSSGGVFYRASANMSDKLPDGVAYGCSVLAQTTRRGEWLYTQDGKWLPLSPALTGEVSFEEMGHPNVSSNNNINLSRSREGGGGGTARSRRKKAVRVLEEEVSLSEKQQLLVTLGNKLLAFTIAYCAGLHALGGYFSIENPEFSYSSGWAPKGLSFL